MRLIAALLWLCIALPSQALAQHDPSNNSASSDYRELIKLGIKEFSLANWVEARVLFRRAHELMPSARTYRSLGMVAFELRDYPTAVRALSLSLRDGRKPLTADMRREVEELLRQADRYIGHYEVAIDGVVQTDARERGEASAAVKVDDKPGVFLAGRWLLATGSHAVSATSGDGRKRVKRVQVEGGERARIDFASSHTTQAQALTPSEASPATRPNLNATGPQASEDGALPIVPIALAGAGGALVVAGIVTGLMAHGVEADLERACMQKSPCPEEHRDLQDRGNDLATATNVLLIGGGALAAFGLTFWWLSSPEQPDVALQAQLSPGLAYLGVEGRL